jgi:glutamate carboxypeptidase
MNPNALKSEIEAYQTRILSTLGELVRHETPSTEKAALDGYADRLAGRFNELGCDTILIPNEVSGAHLKATYPSADTNSDKPALLLCHYDTVWPLGTLEKMPFRVAGDKAFGPGIYDMKASHAMAEHALLALKALGMQLPRPIVILFTSDEEVGSRSSRKLIEELASGAEYVLVLEPPTAEGALKTARKGVGGFRLQVEGRASHAGSQPELGISAINELAYQVLEIQKIADLDKGTTINTGVIRGGTRSNVIAAQAEAKIDVRAWTPEEAERVERSLKALQPITPGAELSVEGGFERPPLVRTEAVARLFQRVQQVGKQLGLDLEEGSTGGASDGNFTAALGVPTLDGIGAMGDGAHADHEHILVSQLPVRAALLAAVISSI